MEKIILPQNKFDFDTCQNIQNLSDEKFQPLAEELLTWLQDGNWPIFPEIIKIFIAKQDIAMIHIAKVFSLDDAIWQYYILTELYSNLSEKNKIFLQKDLEKCFKKLSIKSKLDEDETDVKGILSEILIFKELDL